MNFNGSTTYAKVCVLLSGTHIIEILTENKLFHSPESQYNFFCLKNITSKEYSVIKLIKHELDQQGKVEQTIKEFYPQVELASLHSFLEYNKLHESELKKAYEILEGQHVQDAWMLQQTEYRMLCRLIVDYGVRTKNISIIVKGFSYFYDIRGYELCEMLEMNKKEYERAISSTDEEGDIECGYGANHSSKPMYVRQLLNKVMQLTSVDTTSFIA